MLSTEGMATGTYLLELTEEDGPCGSSEAGGMSSIHLRSDTVTRPTEAMSP